ncbi:MAG: CopD family protein [Pseudomonadota bacterium]
MISKTALGCESLIRLGGLCMILSALILTGRPKQICLIIGSIITLSAFTQIGHTSVHEDFLTQTLLQIFLLIHLIAISLWVGILLPLYRLSGDVLQIALTAQMAHHFGRIASYFVPVLLVAGGWLAFILTGSWAALLTSQYGQILLAKITFVILLLVLAAFNKLRFVPALRKGQSHTLKRFKQSLITEMILFVCILSITSILTTMLSLPDF